MLTLWELGGFDLNQDGVSDEPLHLYVRVVFLSHIASQVWGVAFRVRRVCNPFFCSSPLFRFVEIDYMTNAQKNMAPNMGTSLCSMFDCHLLQMRDG